MHTTPFAPTEDPTGRCIVFVTPDGERTLNTFLGSSNGLKSSDVDMELVKRAKLLFLEGYLWDPPKPPCVTPHLEWSQVAELL